MAHKKGASSSRNGRDSNAQYLGVVEAGLNVPSLSLIMEVCEVLGADAGAMIREVAEARKKPPA